MSFVPREALADGQYIQRRKKLCCEVAGSHSPLHLMQRPLMAGGSSISTGRYELDIPLMYVRNRATPCLAQRDEREVGVREACIQRTHGYRSRSSTDPARCRSPCTDDLRAIGVDVHNLHVLVG